MSGLEKDLLAGLIHVWDDYLKISAYLELSKADFRLVSKSYQLSTLLPGYPRGRPRIVSAGISNERT